MIRGRTYLISILGRLVATAVVLGITPMSSHHGEIQGGYRQDHCRKAVLPHLIARGEGRIINIASIAGKVGRLGYAHYSASKHAVLGFTKSLAYEMAPYNVTVNAVNPGIVKTYMWDRVLVPHFSKQRGSDPDATFESIIKERIPLGRAQTIEDMVQAVIFLCKAPNITGCSLTVDGGYTML